MSSDFSVEMIQKFWTPPQLLWCCGCELKRYWAVHTTDSGFRAPGLTFDLKKSLVIDLS